MLLNKPKGYVATVTDPEGRPTVLDLVRGIKARLYPVGRLDYLSEGLLLLTNDGALAQKLTHASSHVPKTYLVKVGGKPTDAEISKLRGGVFLPAETTRLKSPEASAAGKPTRRRSKAVRAAGAQIKLVRDAANPWYEITLIEGRNRQIRRMFEQVGHHVEKIKRVRYRAFGTRRRTGQVPTTERAGSKALEIIAGFERAQATDKIINACPFPSARNFPASAAAPRRTVQHRFLAARE